MDASTDVDSAHREYDPITGLPTLLRPETFLRRRAFWSALNGRGLSVLLLELDAFREVEQHLGREVGDTVLREMAARLKMFATTVVRLKSGQFLLLQTDDPTREDSAELANLILLAVRSPTRLARGSVTLSASIGIVMVPEQGGGFDDLLDGARHALAEAKSGGGGGFAFFEGKSQGASGGTIDLLGDLTAEVRDAQLELVYLPTTQLSTGRATGVEALVRWHHPVLGVVPAATLLTVARRQGWLEDLETWVLRRACEQLGQWHADGLKIRLAVNLSADGLTRPDFATRIVDLVRWSGIEPHLLTCELGEAAVVRNVEAAERAIRTLKDAGIRVSLDHFGNGPGGLAQLRGWVVDELKIGRNVVRFLGNSDASLRVAAAVIAMGRTLSAEVVAAGVETSEQLALLRELGYDQVQGHLFSRPMAGAAVPRWASHPNRVVFP